MRYLTLLMVLFVAPTAEAYIGPGLGAGVIAVIVGLFVSIFLAFLALFWYPLKRMFGKKPQPAEGETGEDQDE